MKQLVTDWNLGSAGDDVYAALIEAHADLTEDQSRRLDLRMILLLANHIGDDAVITGSAAPRARGARFAGILPSMKIPPLRHDVDGKIMRRSWLALEHGHQRIAVTRMAETVRIVAADEVGVRQRFRKWLLFGQGAQ